MARTSTSPDVSLLDIPMDQWTEPFWQAADQGRLSFPRCAECGRFRWLPGPFCPECLSQAVEWFDVGDGRIYSFTVVRSAASDGGAASVHIPALIEFPAAEGVRLLAAIVDADPDAVEIGATVARGWVAARNTAVPVFRLKAPNRGQPE